MRFFLLSSKFVWYRVTRFDFLFFFFCSFTWEATTTKFQWHDNNLVWESCHDMLVWIYWCVRKEVDHNTQVILMKNNNRLWYLIITIIIIIKYKYLKAPQQKKKKILPDNGAQEQVESNISHGNLGWAWLKHSLTGPVQLSVSFPIVRAHCIIYSGKLCTHRRTALRVFSRSHYLIIQK